MKKNTRIKKIIVKSTADFFSPIILIFGFYILFHGHLYPGGGFLGGALVAAAAVLIYLGYGREYSLRLFKREFLRRNGALGGILHIFLALIGLFFFTNFCRNILYDMGEVGTIFSSGTIFLSNLSMGYGTITGLAFLLLLFLGFTEAEENDNDNE